MAELTEAEKLYEAAKVVLSTCPDCGYEWAGCVCYENSDAFWEDMRGAWDYEWELDKGEPDSPFTSLANHKD